MKPPATATATDERNPIILDRRERRADEAERDSIYSELCRFDVPVLVAELQFGDCVFDGQGEVAAGKGHATIGCERKKLSDLMNCIHDRRLSGHQLKGMHDSYDYLYLFVEGLWRPTANEDIEVGKEDERGSGRIYWRPFPTRQPRAYRTVMGYLTTISQRGGVEIRYPKSVRETATQYLNLWHWYNDKPWEAHTSHDQVYLKESAPRKVGKVGFSPRADPGFIYKVACQIPGVDSVGASRVAEWFEKPGAPALATATVKQWMQVPGIGKTRAEAAVKAMGKLLGRV